MNKKSKKNKKVIKPMLIREYVGKQNIEKWLLENYTFTDKRTFISAVQLFDEYNNSFDPFKIPVPTDYNLEARKLLKCYVTFWATLNDVLEELEWNTKEGFLYYTDDDTDQVSEKSDRIQGIFHLLKKKDIGKNIIEAPKNDILDFADRSYYIDFFEDDNNICYIFDFKSVEENTHSENINKLIEGYPYSDEYIHEAWYSFPTIYRYWKGVITKSEKTNEEKINK